MQNIVGLGHVTVYVARLANIAVLGASACQHAAAAKSTAAPACRCRAAATRFLVVTCQFSRSSLIAFCADRPLACIVHDQEARVWQLTPTAANTKARFFWSVSVDPKIDGRNIMGHAGQIMGISILGWRLCTLILTQPLGWVAVPGNRVHRLQKFRPHFLAKIVGRTNFAKFFGRKIIGGPTISSDEKTSTNGRVRVRCPTTGSVEAGPEQRISHLTSCSVWHAYLRRMIARELFFLRY